MFRRGVFIKFTVLAIRVLFFLIALDIYAQERGSYFIRSYTDDTYRAHPSNWCSFQDSTGTLFFGNRSVVLQYDGENWEKILIKPNASVYDIQSGPGGRVYVGTKGDFGYLAADSTGKTTYYSLLSLVPEEYRVFREVWKIHVLDDAVFFQSKEFLFRLKGGQFDTWVPETSFHFSHLVNGTLYIKDLGRGLMMLKEDKLVLVDERFKGNERKDHIYAMLPYGKDQILIATGNDGLYTYSSTTSRILSFPVSDEALVRSSNLYDAIKLSDGNYAFATLNEGVFILSPKGEVLKIIHKSSGLDSHFITSIRQDSTGALWLTSNEGIYRVAYEMPITYWGTTANLQGSIFNIMRYDQTLYVATSEGVFYLQDETFTKVDGLNQHAWYFWKFMPGTSNEDSLLLVATDVGVYKIEDRTASLLIRDNSTILFSHPTDPATLWVGGLNGISLHKYDGAQLRRVGKVTGLTQRIIDIQADSYGAVWVGTDFHGLFKLTKSTLSGFLNSEITFYDKDAGLKSIEEIRIYINDNRIMVLAGHHLYTYDDRQDYFVPYMLPGHVVKEGNEECISYHVDAYGDYWIQCKNDDYDLWIDNIHKVNESQYDFQRVPFDIIPRMLLRQVYSEPKEMLWLVGSESIFKYHRGHQYRVEPKHNTLIRKIIINEDSTIHIPLLPWATNTEKWQEPKPLSFEHNNLTFFFSSTSFRNENSNLYQFKLEGLNQNWSSWTEDAKANFTSLDPGEYVFRVRSMGFDKQMSDDAIYTFTILPPWYRTTYAYGLYVLLITILVWLLMELKTRRIERLNQQLERKVQDRTKEVREQNKQITSQKEEITEQNVELRQLNVEKNYLIGTVAHDLKNPLSSIYSISQLLKMGEDALDQEQLDYVNQVEKLSLSLTEKIADVLDVTSFDAHINAPVMKRGEITSLVTEVVKTFKPISARKNIKLKYKKSDSKFFAHYDTHLMTKVLGNLIDNAIKFSPFNSAVKISISRPEKRLNVCIQDFGPGISREDQERLFDRFTTVTPQPTNGEKSTGLGLSIVKKYLTAMNGKVSCKSQLGHGTTFIVEI